MGKVREISKASYFPGMLFPRDPNSVKLGASQPETQRNIHTTYTREETAEELSGQAGERDLK